MTDQTTHRGSGGGPQFEPAFLIRYVTGRATAVEADAVEAWLAADPARGRELEALRRVWDASGHSFSEDEPYIIDQEWARLADMVRGSQSIPTASRRGLRGFPVTDRGMVALPNPWPRGLGGGRVRSWAAPSILVLVVVGVGVAIGVRRGAGPGSRAHEYATVAGQRLSITLMDGTQLTLAPASRVRVGAGYDRSAGAREVELTGEAYFAVAHDGAHPFTVRAQGAVARDVGTAFDVRAYPEDTGARIAVIEGVAAVSTETGQRSCLLPRLSRLPSGEGCGSQVRAGDIATVANEAITVMHGGDVASLTGWRAGRLAFRDTPLREVAVELARWYGLDVRVPDAGLADRPVTGTFTTEPVDEVLSFVAHPVGAIVRRAGQTVTFVRGGE